MVDDDYFEVVTDSLLHEVDGVDLVIVARVAQQQH